MADTEKPPAPLAFVDTETTGTNPFHHEVWDVGIIIDDIELEWRIEPDLRKADPMALQIGKYYQRKGHGPAPVSKEKASLEIASVLAGRHMVGMVPSFDSNFLERFLRNNGHAPAWHYHLVDVEALIAGHLGIVPPWRSKELSYAVGVMPEAFERHTAIGDARWAKACFEAVMRRQHEKRIVSTSGEQYQSLGGYPVGRPLETSPNSAPNISNVPAPVKPLG